MSSRRLSKLLGALALLMLAGCRSRPAVPETHYNPPAFYPPPAASGQAEAVRSTPPQMPSDTVQTVQPAAR